MSNTTITLKKSKVKVRKVTPDHAKSAVHKDRTKFDRGTYKQELLKQSDLNWDGNDD